MNLAPRSSSSSRLSAFFADACFVVKGLAHDFWKDGAGEKTLAPPPSFSSALSSSIEEEKPQPLPQKPADQRPLWAGDRSQILQKMWGNGYILPGGDAITDLLMTPLGLTKEKSVLDLTAGLGGLARKVSSDYGTYVTGMEEDQALVPIGMMMSLAAGKSKQASVLAYVPETFTTQKTYDCIVARELFYRLHDKERLFDVIAKALKPKGHLVFTDYTLEEAGKGPEIDAWLTAEGGITPLSLEKIKEIWKAHKFDVRINEDLTNQYKKEILAGLMRFARFLASKKPDHNTKMMIMKELEIWAHRVVALEQGAKLYRFHVIKR